MLARLKRKLFDGEVLRLMFLAALVRPIGMVTQMLLASYFGASEEYDAYVLAFFLVTFAEMGFGRVFTAVVVPYTVKLKKTLDERGLFAFQTATYLLFAVPGIVYSISLFFGGDHFVALAGPRAPRSTLELATEMVKIMALPGLGLMIVSMGKGTLNSHGRFRVPGSLPIVHSAVFLATVYFAHDRLGIFSLPLAFTLGVSARLILIAVWGYISRTLRPAPPSLPAGTMKTLWALSWMILVSTIFQTINGFLDKMFASGLEPGSMSSVMYSQTLMNFGMQLFTFSLVTVMFTRMSELIADGDFAGCDVYVEGNLNRVLKLVVPGCLAMALTSPEIVRVLFQRGAFTPEDTVRTSNLLAMYMLGLPAIITNSIITRIFHTMQRMRAKLWLALQYLLTNLAGNLILVGILKVVGLAISSSFAINSHLFLSLLVLHRWRTGLGIARYTRIILTAYALALATWVLLELTGTNAWFDALSAGRDRLGILFCGAARFTSVMATYTVLFLIHRQFRILRRRRAT